MNDKLKTFFKYLLLGVLSQILLYLLATVIMENTVEQGARFKDNAILSFCALIIGCSIYLIVVLLPALQIIFPLFSVVTFIIGYCYIKTNNNLIKISGLSVSMTLGLLVIVIELLRMNNL